MLEDVAPARQGDQIAGCSVEQARLAMHELARVHAPVFGDSQLGATPWLNQEMPLTQALVSQLLPGFLERYGDRVAPAHREVCERFVASLDGWGVEFRLPDAPRIGVGYLQPVAGGVIELDSVRATEEVGPDGLITAARIDFGPDDLSLSVTPLAFGPLRLVAPDGRVSSFPRAMCRVSADDGHSGVAWVEWNRNRSVG